MIRCIAIDDEPLALRQLQTYISKVECLESVAMCRSASEAQQVMQSEEVDLLFVDINMPDVNGVEFVRSLTSHPLVIFTTAYSEYAIEGFRLDAVDYLLKPFSLEDFTRAVQKAQSLLELRKMRQSQQQPESELQPQQERDEQGKDYISIKADYKVTLVKYADIVYVESVGEYVRLNLKDGSKLTTLFRLKNMESALPSKSFMRVHRSYIVNLGSVTSYARDKVYLENGDYLPISVNYRDAFREYFLRRQPQQ